MPSRRGRRRRAPCLPHAPCPAAPARAPPKQVQLEAEGTEMLARQRAKLMSMSPDKKWKDKGQGTLTLRRAAGGAAGQPYFVFTTDSGAGAARGVGGL